MTSATVASPSASRILPPVLGRLLTGTFWLALRTPIQAVTTLWTTRLILQAIGPDKMGAFTFAMGFGFFQNLFEFGISSALQRQISESWTKGDRDGVDRAIACGMKFYLTMAAVQSLALLGIAYAALPFSDFHGDSYRLIVKLLWLQALTSPCYGMSVVVSSVLQAARRYDFIPRLELGVIVLRFLLLVGGVATGADFFGIVVAQTAVTVGLSLGPALWVMGRDLGHVPHFGGARRSDFAGLLHISFFMFLIQLSVVLATSMDRMILGFALVDPGPANAIYDVVSKPFMQVRQTGMMFTCMVIPAVASLAAARDARGLERVKYDGPRLHIGLILPIALLAYIYAAPFLAFWVGDRLGSLDSVTHAAPLMRLFLIAALPLLISVHVQMAIGMNKIKVTALSALAGALVNLPVSYVLTLKFGVSGVIWGTVLTTVFSNLLIPGLYVFRVLEIDPKAYFRRTLSAPIAGAVALIVATGICRFLFPISPERMTTIGLLAHLSVGCLAYLAGYLLVPAGRGDWSTLTRKLRLRPATS